MMMRQFSFALTMAVMGCCFQSCIQNPKNMSKKDTEWPTTGNFTHRTETELDSFLIATMDSLEIPGISFAYITDASLRYHRAFGIANTDTGKAVDSESIFEAASISKSVFAYFTLVMAEKWIIDLERPLYFYWENPDFRNFPETKSINAEMVLSHRTGFPNWRWFTPPPDSLEVERGDFYMMRKPGEFNYSGEAYQYLANVLAKNNHVDMYELGDLVDQEVFSKLDMDRSFFVWDDFIYGHKVWGHQNGRPDGREWGTGLPHMTSKTLNAAGGLHTEAEDFSKFVIELLNRNLLLSEAYENMFALHTKVPKTDPFYTKQQVVGWGLGLEIMEVNGNRYYGHGGNNTGFTSFFLMDLEGKNAYIFFINCEKGDALNTALMDFLLES